MDPEVIKALKNASINDDIKNIDSTKKENKNKTKKTKKNNNKKGDFLDFAQEKGIDFKLQYEDKEDQKKNYYQKDNKNFQGGKPYQKNFNENYKNKDFNGNYNGKNFKYQNNKKFGFQNKSKNNKFDQANIMYNPNMNNGMNKNMMNPYPNQGMNFMNNGQQDFNFDPFFTPERTCEEILGYIFSVEFLNRELYLRKRITTEGLIDINHVMIFNKYKIKNFLRIFY